MKNASFSVPGNRRRMEKDAKYGILVIRGTGKGSER